MLKAQPQIRLLRPAIARPDLPIFLFLPGMDGTDISLKSQLRDLQQHFDIHCLTLPADDHSDWTTLAQTAVELLKRKNAADRPVYLCGESFGGCLALQIAAAYPQLLDRLILINPASSFGKYFWMGWGTDLLPPLPYYLYYFSAFGLLPFLAAFDRIEIDLYQALLSAMQAVTQTSARWRLKLLKEFKPNWVKLSQLEQPTLIIASRADRLLPSLAEAENLKQAICHAQIVVLPNSGHVCLLERQIKLTNILRSHGFIPPPPIDPAKQGYDKTHKEI